MDKWDKSYPKIDSLEVFSKLLTERGRTLIEKVEPKYYQRFKTCEKLGLNANQTHNECDPLLIGNLNKFVNILEALYEVRYYWKRLTETSRLLEVKPPVTEPEQINNAQWFTYSLDSYWHAQYGFLERIKILLNRLERAFKLKKDAEERILLREFIDLIEQAHSITKAARDPIAHQQSMGIEGWRVRHDWEASLVRESKWDFIEVYDNRMLYDKEFYLGYIRQWVEAIYETMGNVFRRLALLPLDKLG